MYTGISVGDKVYEDLSVYTVSLCQSVTRCIAACHLDCIPEYLSTAKYTKTSVCCTVTRYMSVTQGIVACHLKCTPEYQSATKYMKTCQLHCTPMYQSVTWNIHSECIDLPGIHSECIDLPEYRSATTYTKTCQLHCSQVYQSVIRDITACHPDCFLVYFVADQYSLVYTLDDRPLYTGLLTDIPGSSVAYRSSYTLSLTDIPVYTPGDKPLYPRLQTNMLGNSVADRYSYTLSLIGIRSVLYL